MSSFYLLKIDGDKIRRINKNEEGLFYVVLNQQDSRNYYRKPGNGLEPIVININSFPFDEIKPLSTLKDTSNIDLNNFYFIQANWSPRLFSFFSREVIPLNPNQVSELNKLIKVAKIKKGINVDIDPTKNIVFFDDSLENIQSVELYCPEVDCFWINERDQNMFSDYKQNFVVEVGNLYLKHLNDLSDRYGGDYVDFYNDLYDENKIFGITEKTIESIEKSLCYTSNYEFRL